jgi:hypothetical protein
VRPPASVPACVELVTFGGASLQYRCREHGDSMTWRPSRFDPTSLRHACEHLRPIYQAELWRGNVCCGACEGSRGWVIFVFRAGFARHVLARPCLAYTPGDTHHPDEHYSCSKHRQDLVARYNHSLEGEQALISRTCVHLRGIVEAEWKAGNDVARVADGASGLRLVMERPFRGTGDVEAPVKTRRSSRQSRYVCCEHRQTLVAPASARLRRP